MSEFVQSVKRVLQRFDIDIHRYRHSVPARRQQIWSHYGIELLVDVGANVGQYATAARRGGYLGDILSLEPLRDPYQRLVAAASSDGKWATRQTAVGAEVGKIAIHVSQQSIFSSVLSPSSLASEATDGVVAVADEQVPITTLDELVPASAKRVSIKIDVQGYERNVLQGGVRAISNATIVEMELSPQPMYAGQMLMVEAIERLEAAGLTLSLAENIWVNRRTGRARQFNGIFVRD